MPLLHCMSLFHYMDVCETEFKCLHSGDEIYSSDFQVKICIIFMLSSHLYVACEEKQKTVQLRGEK